MYKTQHLELLAFKLKYLHIRHYPEHEGTRQNPGEENRFGQRNFVFVITDQIFLTIKEMFVQRYPKQLVIYTIVES